MKEAGEGDQVAFEQLTEPHRRELNVHCYRMLGSIEDAEDAVQETFLRAWARLDTFAGRASFRAWLYGIATNACLDMLRRRKSRLWPTDVAGPADLGSEPTRPPTEVAWLQPYPDRLLAVPAPAEAEPEVAVAAKETIELAFLAAIQRLPARQRAVLILRDVLDWSAKDTATTLEMTTAAVNSALQRAHAGLAAHVPPDRDDWLARDRVTAAATEKALLHRLVEAWERTDTTALVTLLRDDARLVMPPRLTWFAGIEAIEHFFRTHVFDARGRGWRLLPTWANRQPAFALYQRAADADEFQPFGIGVLTVDRGAIGELALFADSSLFERFGMPKSL
ncbi:RNA polymerase sigma factor [Asanoa ferruginea]|uniref:sigma-70 family RNA polymerase sigma factor n=1 Tax=Asanoa ferruginea TaxID=53367 RepID=UPI001A642908|nr:sigma-70 family RNA polymerase sigma factor [Asanoa ferruginea]GIF47935.1 RNA polymerase sigma factor [Asanoa ferruginea]